MLTFTQNTFFPVEMLLKLSEKEKILDQRRKTRPTSFVDVGGPLVAVVVVVDVVDFGATRSLNVSSNKWLIPAPILNIMGRKCLLEFKRCR